jgi:hypothetical protein
MRIITPDEKAHYLQVALQVSDAAAELMDIDDLKASAYNLTELLHHLEHANKYLIRILEENSSDATGKR